MMLRWTNSYAGFYGNMGGIMRKVRCAGAAFAFNKVTVLHSMQVTKEPLSLCFIYTQPYPFRRKIAPFRIRCSAN